MVEIMRTAGWLIMAIGTITIITSWFFGQIDSHIGMHTLIVGWLIINSAEIKELQKIENKKMRK